MRIVIALEFSQLWHRLGGARGLLMLAALAALGTLLPMRLGPALLDPVYLLAYSILAAIFAGTYSIQSWAGADERAWLENRGDEAPSDSDVFRGKTLVASIYGLGAWLIIFGASLAALSSSMRTVYLPRLSVLAALVLFTLTLSAMSSSAAALLAVHFESPALARQMFRLALFFIVLAGVVATRAYPALLRPISNPSSLVLWLASAPALFAALAILFGKLTLRSLADKRISLSINL